MLSDLTQWLGAHTQWLGVAIFLVSLTESLAVAGLVVPGVFLLFAFAALAASADMSLLEAIVWAFCGAVIGDLLSFALGRWFHQDIRRLSLFRRHPQWIDRGERFFRRYGWVSVVLGRFIGPIRPIIPLVAGMFDMPAWRFVAINLLSALAWAPAYLIPGYLIPGYSAGRAARWAVPPLFWNQALSIAVGAVIVVGGSLYLLRLQRRWSALAAAAVCLLALLVLSANQSALAIFSDTLVSSRQFLQLPGSERLALLHPSLLLVTLPIAALLLLLRQWGAVSLLLLTLAFALLLDWIIGLSLIAATSSLVLAVLGALLVICNRERPFWWRASWLLYPLPFLALLLGNLLQYEALEPLELLRALLCAASASLLACWLIERFGPLPRPPRTARWAIALWPYLVVAWLLW